MTWLTAKLIFLFGKWIQPGRSWSRICWSLWRLPRTSGATDATVTETESKGPGSEPAPGVSEFSFSASRFRIPTSCRTCRWRGRLAWQGRRRGYGRPPRWSWRAPSSSFRTMRSCEKIRNRCFKLAQKASSSKLKTGSKFRNFSLMEVFLWAQAWPRHFLKLSQT